MRRRHPCKGHRMTDAQVRALMAQAGAAPDDKVPIGYDAVVSVFAHFAELVAAGEREACAATVEAMREKSRNHLFRSALTIAASEFRARSKP